MIGTPTGGSYLAHQRAALKLLEEQYPEEASRLIAFIVKAQGRIVFTGMGKSGHVGRLLTATFSSVGLPALFLHPSEAVHGDSGGIVSGDICICLSKSGASDEIAAFLTIIQSLDIVTWLWTCQPADLVRLVDFVIHLPLVCEIDPYNVVPTSSVLVMLAFGQSVAVQAALKKGFTPATFRRVHPGGSLGKRLQREE